MLLWGLLILWKLLETQRGLVLGGNKLSESCISVRLTCVDLKATGLFTKVMLQMITE